ncbi:choice-of-anchor A family protein [bacterium]|nr:MAG: choice-of-anchor A family protein [bacterium]
MLWNFQQISTLTIGQRDFNGSILAPGASVIVDGGNVNGHVIANSLLVNNGKELHMGSGITFNGVTPVPEPASLAALAVGAAALLRRRRRG